MLKVGWLGLLAALGAWAFAVALFSWRRDPWPYPKGGEAAADAE